MSCYVLMRISILVRRHLYIDRTPFCVFKAHKNRYYPRITILCCTTSSVNRGASGYIYEMLMIISSDVNRQATYLDKRVATIGITTFTDIKNMYCILVWPRVTVLCRRGTFTCWGEINGHHFYINFYENCCNYIQISTLGQYWFR